MISSYTPLKSYEQTLGVIADFARRYKSDVSLLSGLSPIDFYDYVHGLPYIDDPEGVERVSRPAFTIDPNWKNSRDCDDKTAIVGAYCELNGIPWRMVVAGQFENPHHVYPEIKLGSLWVPFDTTYPQLAGIGIKLYDPERFRRVVYPDHALT